jgi:hypothetical protein
VYLHYSYRRYIRVLEPAAVFREMADEDVWGDDAVHPSAAAYRQLAMSSARLAEGALSMPIGTSKRQRTADASDEGDGEASQRGGGWRPLGGGRYLRYENRDGDGGGDRGEASGVNTAAGRRYRQEVEVIGEYGGGSGGGGGSGSYSGGGGGGGQRGRPWNSGGRGYGGGGRRPRRL